MHVTDVRRHHNTVEVAVMARQAALAASPDSEKSVCFNIHLKLYYDAVHKQEQHHTHISDLF